LDLLPDGMGEKKSPADRNDRLGLVGWVRGSGGLSAEITVGGHHLLSQWLSLRVEMPTLLI